MFSHVMLGTDDLPRAKAFYDAVLATLGYGPGIVQGDRAFWMSKGGTFSVSKPIDGEAATCANGGTIGFAAPSPDKVREFHDVAVANGGTSIEDPPGLRESEMGAMHLSYVRDLDGNKLCALHRPG